MNQRTWNRREVLAAAACTVLPGTPFADPSSSMRTAMIPSSGEALPVVGLGTYSVFDVESSDSEIASKHEIMRLLIEHGGSVIDTSPMYRRSERVIGDVIRRGIDRRDLFIATKVWTDGQDAGIAQMRRSAELMNSETIDLMQVHNLRDTDIHLRSIRELQQDGRIRYCGITHYTASALDDLERAMVRHEPQFVQINYSLGERDAERRILPLARDMGIAVLINRPFQAGRLFSGVRGKPLPEFAADIAASWGQFFLKFIISHPSVTCAIPGTSKAHHMVDNLGAGFGAMPDSDFRKRMSDYFTSL